MWLTYILFDPHYKKKNPDSQYTKYYKVGILPA